MTTIRTPTALILALAAAPLAHAVAAGQPAPHSDEHRGFLTTVWETRNRAALERAAFSSR